MKKIAQLKTKIDAKLAQNRTNKTSQKTNNKNEQRLIQAKRRSYCSTKKSCRSRTQNNQGLG